MEDLLTLLRLSGITDPIIATIVIGVWISAGICQWISRGNRRWAQRLGVPAVALSVTLAIISVLLGHRLSEELKQREVESKRLSYRLSKELKQREVESKRLVRIYQGGVLSETLWGNFEECEANVTEQYGEKSSITGELIRCKPLKDTPKGASERDHCERKWREIQARYKSGEERCETTRDQGYKALDICRITKDYTLCMPPELQNVNWEKSAECHWQQERHMWNQPLMTAYTSCLKRE